MPVVSESPAEGQPRWPKFFLLGVMLLCVLAYLPALRGEFVFDDLTLLVQYDCWRGLSKIPSILGFGEPSTCNYRPIRYVTFAIDYAIGGMNPMVYHISSLVYHLLTVLAVYLLLRRWASAGVAVVMVALWALHPVNTDAVAYISGRRDIISTLFFVVAFLQLYPPEGKRLNVRRVLLGVLCFGLALGAKEMAVTLPAVLIWAAISRRAGALGELKGHLKRFWPLYAVLLVGAGAFVAYAAVFKSHSFMSGRWWGGSPVSNFATVFRLYAHYLGLVVWPARLVGDYFPFTIPLSRNFADPVTLLGLFLYAGLLSLVVVSLRRGWRATAFGIGWFLITMLPVSHIFPHHELFAEHYLYLPMIGLAAAALPLVRRLGAAAPRLRRPAIALAAIAIVAFSARTAVRAANFRTARDFYAAAYAAAPNNARAAYNLGLSHLEAGECEEAVPLFVRASRFLRRRRGISRPNLIRFLNCSEQVGRTDLVDSVVTEMLRRNEDDPLGLYWRGRRSFEHGDVSAAISDLSRAVTVSPRPPPQAVTLLATALNRARMHEQALRVLQHYPGEDEDHCVQEVLAMLGLGLEHYSDAFQRVQRCLQLHPDSLRLLEFRAGLYMSAGEDRQAEADLERMQELGATDEDLERIRAWRNRQ